MSKPIIKHFGKIMNGKLYFSNEALWEQQRLALESKEFELIIKEKHKKATNDQYGYYRGGILGTCYTSEMFSHFDKPDDIHENYFAPKFLSYTTMVTILNPKTGNTERFERVKVRSMAELDRKETGEFIDKCIADCEVNGIHILTPEEYYEQHTFKRNING